MQSKNTGYEGKPAIYTIGGFTVNVQREEFNFDFTETYHFCNVNSEGRITVESELRYLDWDSFGESDFSKVGATNKEIYAHIQKAEAIEMVFYECFMDDAETKHVPMQFVSLEIGGTKIDKSLIDDYNRKELKRRLTGS